MVSLVNLCCLVYIGAWELISFDFHMEMMAKPK
jgi:hypothetical protein